MNIAICDDDRVIIEQIEEFLQIIHDKSLEYEVFFCAEELQKYITENNVNFDVFILDIEMNKCNGFEVRDALFSQRINSRIIYLSDYKDRLQDAFGKNVYGFVSRDSIL